MADTASLIVRVTTNGVTAASRQLRTMTESARASAERMKKLAESTKAVALATTGVVAGMALATDKIAKHNVELSNMARLSGSTVSEFKNQSFAASQYGFTMEKLSDSFKDTTERIGDYLNGAGGPLQDFADAMGLNKAQTTEFAKSVVGLSGREVLTLMVERMQKAGKSTEEMSHALEGMASDVTLLIPLLQDGGAKFDALSAKMALVTVPITESDIEQFRDLSIAVDLAKGSMTSMLTSAITPMIPDTIRLSDAISHFFASLNKGTEASLTSKLVGLDEEIKNLESDLISLDSWTGRLGQTVTFGSLDKTTITRNLKELREDYAKTQAELAEMSGLTPKNPNVNKDGETAPKDGRPKDNKPPVKSNADLAAEAALQKQKELAEKTLATQKQGAQSYLDMLAESNMTELELIESQRIAKNNKLAEYRANELITEQEHKDAFYNVQMAAYNKEAELAAESAKAIADAKQADADREDKITQKKIDDGISAQSNMTSNLKVALGENNDLYKASAITTATIDTYKAATGAYAAAMQLGPVGLVLGPIAAGAAIAAGLANVAAITSAREQGGTLNAGQTSTIAERGQFEVIAPASASRVRTAKQMQQMMGEPNNKGGGDSVVIVNNTSANIESATTERDDEGRLRVIINEQVSGALQDSNSDIAKSRRATRGVAGY